MAEQHVYDTLWREARVVTDEYREITIGYRTLAEKARLHRNTIDRNLASLQAKLAIEITKAEDRAENIGRTYRVYGFRSILNRRAAVGLIWFMKDRSGVRLLREQDLDPNISQVTRPLPTKVTGRVTFRHTGAVPSEIDHPVTTEVTTNRQEENSYLATSSTSVAAAVQEELGYVDNEAIARIVSGCRKRVPDATEAEIAHFARLTARRVRSIRNLENPVGFLIIQVPKCFEGETFQNYRKSEWARKETEKRETLRLANEILQDAEMPEESRRWAENVLMEHGPQEDGGSAA